MSVAGRELNVADHAIVEELPHDLRPGDDDAVAGASPASDHVGVDEMVPLVGRVEEFEYVRSAMQDGRGAIVGGASGVGKTRLAREVAAQVDGPVRWASATPTASAIPLGGLAGLDLTVSDPPPNRAGLLALLTAQLLGGAGSQTVVVVDDAHLLDDLSAALVHHLVVSCSARVLLTIRSGEPVPTPIVSLYKDQHLPRLELQPLSVQEFEALADALVGGALDASSHRRLWSLAGGNALFLRELVADGRGAAAFTRATDDRWHWQSERSIGPRLTELVIDRMGRLDERRRALAELLAVGEPLALPIVEELVPGGELAAAERDGLIAVEETARRVELRLAHPLFGEVLRARMPVLERRALQARLAETFERTGDLRPDDALRVAFWRLESATVTDPVFMLRAAQRARASFDAPLAIRLARASQELAPSFDAALVLGVSLAERGDIDAARTVLDGLVGSERDARDREVLTHERAWVAFHSPNGLVEAREILEASERSTAESRSRLLARRDVALLLTYAGRFAEASSIVEPLVGSDMDDEIRLHALSAVGACLTMAGRHEAALALCDDLEAANAASPRPHTIATLHLLATRVNARILGGWIGEAVALVTPVVDPDDRQPRLRAADLGYARTKLGRAYLAQGLAGAAAAQLTEAITLLRGTDLHLCLNWAVSLAAEARVLLGDLEQARELRDEATASRDFGALVFDGDAARARAWVDLGLGEHSRALDALVEAAELQESRGQPAFAMFALHDALRLGGAGLATRIEKLARVCDGPFPAAAAAHAAALRADDPETLERVAEDFESLPMHLAAAEIWATAGRQWQAASQRARASAANRRVQEQLARAQVGSTPLLATVANLGSPTRLTRREEEVAMLAARGLTNAEIADRLCVSVRTVESHLYAAYGKLGITDRAALAAVVTAQ